VDKIEVISVGGTTMRQEQKPGEKKPMRKKTKKPVAGDKNKT